MIGKSKFKHSEISQDLQMMKHHVTWATTSTPKGDKPEGRKKLLSIVRSIENKRGIEMESGHV